VHSILPLATVKLLHVSDLLTDFWIHFPLYKIYARINTKSDRGQCWTRHIKNPTDNIKAGIHSLFVTSYQEDARFMLQDTGRYNLHSIKGMNYYATYNTRPPTTHWDELQYTINLHRARNDFVQQNSASGADSCSAGREVHRFATNQKAARYQASTAV
jgi:hypothetical protein